MAILYNVYTWGIRSDRAENDERYISVLASNYSRMCGDLQRGAERKLKTRSRVRVNISPLPHAPALLFTVLSRSRDVLLTAYCLIPTSVLVYIVRTQSAPPAPPQGLCAHPTCADITSTSRPA